MTDETTPRPDFVTDGHLEHVLNDYAKTDQTEYLENLVIRLQDRIADLEHKCSRLSDDIRNARYIAEDADSKARRAEDAANRAQRGW